MDQDQDDFDLQVYEESESDFLSESKTFATSDDPHAAIIRTSDRITYRRCRRKWDWSYSGRHNLRSKSESAPFWLGSGFHFALEDYHGYHKFEHPSDALSAYERATRKSGLILPNDIKDMLELGRGMLSYYESWLINRERLKTLWIDGVPQVEVNVLIEIPKEDLLRAGCSQKVLDLYTQILYSSTLDRITIDSYNRLWINEYKSAKNYQWYHLDTDQQVTSYSWIAHIKYPQYEIAGTCYQQHKKRAPEPPAFLASTKMFSTSKRQKTTYALYYTALQNLYGPDKSRWPQPNREYLDYVMQNESEGGDSLIKRDYVERNEFQIKNEYQKMLMEVSEMLDPDLQIYPNPTRDCQWDCPFKLPCVHLDSDADWVSELHSSTMNRSAEEAQWRKYLVTPDILSHF